MPLRDAQISGLNFSPRRLDGFFIPALCEVGHSLLSADL
jgi:hypothetical protein